MAWRWQTLKCAQLEQELWYCSAVPPRATWTNSARLRSMHLYIYNHFTLLPPPSAGGWRILGAIRRGRCRSNTTEASSSAESNTTSFPLPYYAVHRFCLARVFLRARMCAVQHMRRTHVPWQHVLRSVCMCRMMAVAPVKSGQQKQQKQHEYQCCCTLACVPSCLSALSLPRPAPHVPSAMHERHGSCAHKHDGGSFHNDRSSTAATSNSSSSYCSQTKHRCA